MDVLRAKFYCDESGFTGTHWADPQQPVFVHGGWLVFEDRVPRLEDALEALRRSARIKAPEIKWKNLARRDDPTEDFCEFFESALEVGCVPCFQLVDKQYFIATKAVETYFDPMYNSRLPMEFTSNFTAKAKLAEVLLTAPAALEAFATWLRAKEEPEVSAIRELALAFSRHLDTHGKKLAAQSLLDFSDSELGDIASEFGSPQWQRSLTGHTLIAVLQHVQKVVGPAQVQVEIVHDNISHFDGLLDMAQGLFGPERGPDLQLGGNHIHRSMPTATGLRLADSKAEIPLQAADLLCGYLRDVATRLRNGDPITASDRAIAKHMIMLGQVFDCWAVNMPQALREAYWLLGLHGRPLD